MKINDVHSIVGSAFKTARVSWRMSQRSSAIYIGISQPALSRIESGHSFPSVETIYRAALAYSVAPGELLPPQS